MPMKISAIYRYPVKGLSPEALSQVLLTIRQGLPHDRRFAIARASTVFDPHKPEWLSKRHFFMLMLDEKLAQLHTRFDEQTGFFAIARNGRQLLNARITAADGRGALEAFFTEFLDDCADGPPRLVEAPGHAFSDARQKPDSTTSQYVSLVNLASVEEVARVAGVAVDPLRFRANLYFEGAPAWSERDWPRTEVRIGKARLRVIAPTTRCPATAVNPSTAARDLDIPRILQKEFGHNHMGVYAEVAEGGVIAPGAPLAGVLP